jgi:thiosulfate/3-mercaptopyruvate sulfurtransferase
MKVMRTINPIISIDWLSNEIGRTGLIILDIRSCEDYATGHIPGSFNVPFPSWNTTRNGLLLELPDEADLFRMIGAAGINLDSWIVIVNKADNPYPLADANRVADTLIYAGIRNVAILDGGYDAWVRARKDCSCEVSQPKTGEYRGKVNKTIFVSKDYVRSQLGKSVILDARDPNVYFGITREPYCQRPGHIPGAKCLPAPWVWNADGTYRNTEELRKMAAGVAGETGSQEIIIYCGVGGYTSAWWFILTQMLGYQNVKFYDGSAQDWTRDPEMPITIYKWE